MSKKKTNQKQPALFTIYYMNQEKVFEMRMLIDNQVKTTSTAEQSNGNNVSGHLGVEADAKVPLVTRLKGSLDSEIKHEKQSKIIDTLEYINTKSRLLSEVISRCAILETDNCFEGQLVYVKNVDLMLLNEVEVRSFIPIMAGTFNGINLPEAGGLDIGNMLQSLLKTSASFKLRGITESGVDVLVKIPIDGDNLFEGRYSIDDLLIGHVDLVGICKGKIKPAQLRDSYEYFQMQNTSKEIEGFIESNQSEDEKPPQKQDTDNKEAIYIDVLAIIQPVQAESK